MGAEWNVIPWVWGGGRRVQVSVVVVVSVGKGKCRGCRWLQSRGSVLRVQMGAE